jgi:redox-sensitive bicupin YhaK (pirin superfamily)
MEAGAVFRLPPAEGARTVRTLYFFQGPSLGIDGAVLDVRAGAVVRCDRPVRLEAGPGACEVLLLQGRPIGEPVAAHGPFVMNTRAQIHEAFADYQRTRFGGWPWPTDDPVHGRDEGRFARHADGRAERGG